MNKKLATMEIFPLITVGNIKATPIVIFGVIGLELVFIGQRIQFIKSVPLISQ
jgi:hypothetical protein